MKWRSSDSIRTYTQHDNLQLDLLDKSRRSLQVVDIFQYANIDKFPGRTGCWPGFNFKVTDLPT